MTSWGNSLTDFIRINWGLLWLFVVVRNTSYFGEAILGEGARVPARRGDVTEPMVYIRR